MANNSNHSKNVIILKPMRPIYYVKGDSRMPVVNCNASKSRYIREDIVYVSQQGDFMQGNPSEVVTITNHVNLLTNCSRTVARVTELSSKELVREVTSDAVAKLIGQRNYDTVFTALCSVINQELKVRGIMALLTDKIRRSSLTVAKEDKEIQTIQSCIEFANKIVPRKRVKRKRWAPYAVRDETKEKEAKDLPDLKYVLSDDSNSNCSISSNLSSLTVNDENILNDPMKLIDHINNCTEEQPGALTIATDINQAMVQVKKETVSPIPVQPSSAIAPESNVVLVNPTYIELLDGSKVMVTVKPEDNFHIATPDILMNCTNEEKQKLIEFQAYIDFKCCLQRDADGLLPIHIAVLTDDLDLLRRQCIVIKHRGESVDVTTDNMTPLLMSINQDPRTTAVLLQRGADPLFVCDEQRTLLHRMAGEDGADKHMEIYLSHCRANARQILLDHELWRPSFESFSDEELVMHLMQHLCSAVDGQGYTPLMLASRSGRSAQTALLLAAAPNSIHIQAPNSGSTALYLAVAEACIDAVGRGNKTKISENYEKTIEALISNGAEATIKNYSGLDVNDLLSDNNIKALSVLVSNALASRNLKDPKVYGSVMLVKNKVGDVKVEGIKKKYVTHLRNNIDRTPKPMIVEDIVVTNTTLPLIDNVNLKPIDVKDNIVSPTVTVARTSRKRQPDSQLSKNEKGDAVLVIPLKKRAYVKKKT